MSDSNPPPSSPPGEKTVVLVDPGLRRLAGGFTQVPNFMLRHEGISVGAKLTYAMLLSYAWQDDFARPAQQTLARDLRSSERSVRVWLTELRKARFIDWKRSGFNRPNIYSILAVPDSALPAEAKKARPTRAKGTGRICRSGPEDAAAMERQDLPATKTQEKKTHSTHRPGVSKPSRDLKLADVLVQRFLNEQGRAPRKATAKELDFAAQLVAEHGYAKADHVVSFGLEAAQRTKFEARFLQGLEQYVAEALADFGEHEKRQARRDRAEAEQRQQEDAAEQEQAAFFAVPIEQRVERAVATWLRTMTTLKKASPTAEEIEERRAWFTTRQRREEAEWRKARAEREAVSERRAA